MTLQFLQGAFATSPTGDAMGGTPTRVDRAMGTPMMGEQPQQMTEQQDVAMETQGQGNNVYAMLRARLPQEVSDEVVKLIYIIRHLLILQVLKTRKTYHHLMKNTVHS